MFFCYVIKSEKTGKFYIGYTSDVTQRIEKHNSGRTRSTKNGIPLVLFYVERFESKTEAIKREIELKSWKSHDKLEKLIW